MTEDNIQICQSTFSTDRDKLHSFADDEIKCLRDVGYAMEPHLTLVGLRELLAGDDLEQQHQLEPITEVFLDHVDLRVDAAQVRIAPCRERLSATQTHRAFQCRACHQHHLRISWRHKSQTKLQGRRSHADHYYTSPRNHFPIKRINYTSIH